MKHACFFILLLTGITLSAQTPQWNWAKGVGSNGEDGVSGINFDSAGNIYEIISVGGQSIRLGTQTFTNPNPQRSTGGGNSIFIFIKYDTKGNVVWAKQFPYKNGYPIYPSSMCTDRYGYSYLCFGVQDSITLGGITARNTGKTSGFCIATYDPNGNVIAIHVKGTNSFYSPNTSIEEIYPWDDGHLLILGSQGNAPDTLDGFPLPCGSFVAIMDTAAKLQQVKYIGHDTLPFGGITLFQPIFGLYGSGGYHICGNDKKSVYVNFAITYKTVLDTSLPIYLTGLTNVSTIQVLIKLDSNFNYQWHQIGNSDILVSMLATDPYDNVFLAAQVGLPGASGFLIIKSDPVGNTLWRDTIMNHYVYNGSIQGIFTDRLGNAYIGGNYDGYLNAGLDTLSDDIENLYVVKAYANGQTAWAQGTGNAVGKIGFTTSFGADYQGNVYISGQYAYTGKSTFGRGNPIFGHDTLMGYTPVNGYPTAADIFNARLGNCNPAPSTLSASSSLNWCGSDSATLTATTSDTYLWNTGDTTQAITVHQTGAYAAYVIDTLGCYAQSKTDTVLAHPQPVLQALVIRDASCYGMKNGQLNLHTTNTTGDVHYSFEPSTTDTLRLGTGTYKIVATDGAGCTDTTTAVVNEPTQLTLQVNYYPPAGGNAGFAVAVASGGTAPYNYSVGVGGEFSSIDTLYGLSPGEYEVTTFDTNGCSATYSLIIPVATAIQQLSQQATSIYPNPTTGSFFIQTQQAGELKIYNQLGAIVHLQTIGAGKSKVETGSLPKGVYVTEVIFNGNRYNNKLIIE